MTPKEFLKGWVTLVAQPWGARYEGETDIATAQQELYFATFKEAPADRWLSACYTLAAKSKQWPSISEVKSILNPSGHPSAEKAWAIISPKVTSDAPTVFVTEPMREAYGAAIALEDDLVAARMAFKEVYTQAVNAADAAGLPVKWSMIPGTDRNMKELAITEAVKKGIAQPDWAMKQLPVDAHESLLQLVGGMETKRIA